MRRKFSDINVGWILGLLCVAALIIATQDPFGWSGYEAPRPAQEKSRCLKTHGPYGTEFNCPGAINSGGRGYVNPGSMEWEVE